MYINQSIESCLFYWIQGCSFLDFLFVISCSYNTFCPIVFKAQYLRLKFTIIWQLVYDSQWLAWQASSLCTFHPCSHIISQSDLFIPTEFTVLEIGHFTLLYYGFLEIVCLAYPFVGVLLGSIIYQYEMIFVDLFLVYWSLDLCECVNHSSQSLFLYL